MKLHETHQSKVYTAQRSFRPLDMPASRLSDVMRLPSCKNNARPLSDTPERLGTMSEESVLFAPTLVAVSGRNGSCWCKKNQYPQAGPLCYS
jgi:hypothetical protein